MISKKLVHLFTGLALQVDNSFLAYFRILFGLIMAVHFHYFLTDHNVPHSNLVESYFVRPTIHYSYYGFGWVKPLPGDLMVPFVQGLLVLSLMLAAGFCYRIAAWLLWIGNAYFFLCERTLYNNHYYLTALILFWMAFVPAHRACSIDAFLFPRIKTSQAPLWTLWILRFHLALPYVFGGIMKLQWDWLSGETCRIVALQIFEKQWIGSLLKPVGLMPLALFLAWSGMIFDLLVVPGLLISKPKWIRWLTCFCIGLFHIWNHFTFHIGIFPWLMLLSTPIFFDPSWIRRLICRVSRRPLPTLESGIELPAPSLQTRFLGISIALYVLFHLVFPFRYLLYPGHHNWTEEADLFAWQMMKRSKRASIQFFTSPAEGVPLQPFSMQALKVLPRHAWRMSTNFDMILQTAHHIDGLYRQRGASEPIIKAISLVSINAREPQLLFNPDLNLAKIPRKLGHQDHILPLESPFRDQPFLAPASEWPKLFDITFDGFNIQVEKRFDPPPLLGSDSLNLEAN